MRTTPSSSTGRNYRCTADWSPETGVLVVALILAFAPKFAPAQDTARAKVDSIAARLERAEEQIKLLQQQMAAQNQSVVQTRSRMALEFNGRVLVTAFSNQRRVNNVDVPLFVRPDTVSPLPQGGAGMAIRQTTLGLAVSSSDVWGAAFTGNVDVDFFGGQQASSGGRTFPLLRMRTARAMLKWPKGELMIGQDAPLISPLNPVSLASVGTPGFTAAGNLWLWLPQVRVGLETGGETSFGLQFAVLAPTSGDAAAAFDTDNDIAEKSKRPYLQGRVHFKWGTDEMAGEIGAGVHSGAFAAAGDSTIESYAVGVDARIPIFEFLEIRGEGYDGKGVRGLGGGAIGQLFGVNGVAVRSRGAWGQVNLKPTPRVIVGGGYGFDDPDDRDLPATGRMKNAVSEGHVHWRPAGPLVFGVEYRRIETTYATRVWSNDHFNLALGFEF